MRSPWAVLVLAVLVLAVLPIAGCSEKSKPNGPIVAEARGEVTQGGVALAAGDAVDPKMEIIVGEGRVTIELPDGATLRLYANTRLRVAKRDSVRLFVGKVWALIAPRFEKRFEVETENAVAGVRGTELIVEASAQRTRVAVVTGSVEVENRGTERVKRLVTRGQEVVVQAEAPPSEPAPFAPEPERRMWEDLGELPTTTPEEDRTEAAEDDTERAIRRPKNELEREGEEIKRRLIEEGERTKRELKKESRRTKRELKEEEAKTRRELEEAEKRAKDGGSVKDFLD